MSRNYYSEINLHLIWHAKGSLPLLTPQVEELVTSLLCGKESSTRPVRSFTRSAARKRTYISR